jgi:hypothetical protein
MKPKKIIGFDSWTKGYKNYSRLLSVFNQNGYSFKLIHLGSWGHDIRKEKEEIIDGINIVDISFYNGKSFFEVLKIEKPDLIIFLSIEAFAHRAFNRYAKTLNIPTINLYHGLIMVQAVENGKQDKYNFLAQSKLVYSRAFKNIFKIWPVYMRSLIETKAGISDWLRFLKDIFTKVFAIYNKKAARDSITNYCVVYTQADVQHAVSKFGANIKNVRVVGNPDIIKFGLSENDFGRFATKKNESKNIIYIDHGGSTCGLNFTSSTHYISFLLELKDELSKKGYNLIVKMHPSQESFETPNLCIKEGLILSSNDHFVFDLRNSCAVITGPSTASMIPALMGLPLFLIQFGPFNGQEYGNLLLNYPRSVLLNDINLIESTLSFDFSKFNLQMFDEWLSKNSGPLPAEQMPNRVLNLIDEILNKDFDI